MIFLKRFPYFYSSNTPIETIDKMSASGAYRSIFSTRVNNHNMDLSPRKLNRATQLTRAQKEALLADFRAEGKFYFFGFVSFILG